MPRATTPLALRLERSARTPLSLQIADQTRTLIRTASSAPGARLPSTRALAAELGVARGVVEQAYDQLAAEGWVESRHGAGTFVARTIRHTPARPAAPPDGRSPREQTPCLRLDSGSPWMDPRHHDGWRRAWRAVAAEQPPSRYPDPAGLPGLRAAVASHVSLHRGVACAPEQVMITAGTAHAFELILNHIGTGAVAIEDPGYRAAVATAHQQGWTVVDVPVDDDGLDVTALAREGRSDIRAIYVTPAHQHPSGSVLSATRRTALIAEARRRGALVIEDDYDSEFRYDVAPLPALAQLGPDDVVYVGTASKTITPGLRIGWLVTSAARVRELAVQREARHDHPSWPVQRALQVMLEEGHVSRLVRSARRIYAERSRIVRDRLSSYGRIEQQVAGMYLVVEMPQEVVDHVVAAAAQAGFEIPSVADYCRSAGRSGLLVGFGGVSDSDLAHALDVIEQALAESAGVDNGEPPKSGVLA